MKENEVNLIKEQLDKLYKIPKNRYGYSPAGVKGWISGTISIAERIFGRESHKIEVLRRIEELECLNMTGDNYYELDDLTNHASSILESFIGELESLGVPTTIYDGKSNGFNLTMIQNQSNTQTIDINIIFDALNDQLTGTQLKEVQSIIDSKESKENKRSKLLNKLKDFGIEAVSNIVTGILMNMIQGKN